MDVWCEAFCCRHINFKTVFQSAPEHAIFIQKIEKFSHTLDHHAFGAQPLPPSKILKYATAWFNTQVDTL